LGADGGSLDVAILLWYLLTRVVGLLCLTVFGYYVFGVLGTCCFWGAIWIGAVEDLC